jgi:integrase/recombinase XerD
MEATARIYYQNFKSKLTVDGLIPVRLVITHKGERKYYSIAHKLTTKEWQALSAEDVKKLRSSTHRGKIKDINKAYQKIVSDAEEIIKALPKFSFAQFEDRYYQKVTKWDNVFEAFLSHISDLRDENRHGYASSFESTLRAIKEFHEGKKYSFNVRKDKVSTRTEFYLTGKKLYFYDLTVSWLKRFEKWMQKDKSRSTQGIYMRNLRALFNLVTKEHGVKADYPFLKYSPKTSTGRKRALPMRDIAKIKNYETRHPQEVFHRDMFMFSFLGNGMNLSDIARLKYSNIVKKNSDPNKLFLVFVRQKTKEKDVQTELKALITKDMQTIIDKYGNRAIGHDAYIFPILKNEWDERQIYYAIKQFTKQVNKYLKDIGKKLELGNITSYTARHSWATISQNSGTSTEYIKKSLGHSSIAVTERYLGSFEEDTSQEHSENMETNLNNAI